MGVRPPRPLWVRCNILFPLRYIEIYAWKIARVKLCEINSQPIRKANDCENTSFVVQSETGTIVPYQRMATSVRLSVKTKWNWRSAKISPRNNTWLHGWPRKQKHDWEQRPTKTKSRYQNLSSTEGRAQERWRSSTSCLTQWIAEQFRNFVLTVTENRRWKWLRANITALEKDSRLVQQFCWRLEGNYWYRLF